MEVNLLRNVVDIVKNMQKIATQVFEASKPMKLVFGKVISVSPLKVNVDQKLELTEEFLVLTNNVLEHETEITVDPDNGGQKKKCIIHNQLKVDDTVIMLRDNGGQKYVILDKVVSE